jgi:hypothetical protein
MVSVVGSPRLQARAHDDPHGLELESLVAQGAAFECPESPARCTTDRARISGDPGGAILSP